MQIPSTLKAIASNPEATLIGACLIGLIGALVAHALLINLVQRLATRTHHPGYAKVANLVSAPTRWISVALVLSMIVRSAPSDGFIPGAIAQAVTLLLPLLIGWLALSALRGLHDAMLARADVSASDNLAARRKQTRIGILARIAAAIIVFLSICMMLMSIPGIRSVGVTLMASAGLAGLAVGAAAQPALKNLIAGLQLAFSEPIRIDDVVIIDGEWGRIEEIQLTYVVVKIWDERRLIVPISKFLESSFQNWTREGSALLGTAFIYVDPATDVAPIRAELNKIVATNENWDRRVAGLQVTDVRPDVMELRALVSASDASKAFDLRCEVREALMQFLKRSAPEALPRRRVEFAPSGDDSPPRPASTPAAAL